MVRATHASTALPSLVQIGKFVPETWCAQEMINKTVPWIYVFNFQLVSDALDARSAGHTAHRIPQVRFFTEIFNCLVQKCTWSTYGHVNSFMQHLMHATIPTQPKHSEIAPTFVSIKLMKHETKQRRFQQCQWKYLNKIHLHTSRNW